MSNGTDTPTPTTAKVDMSFGGFSIPPITLAPQGGGQPPVQPGQPVTTVPTTQTTRGMPKWAWVMVLIFTFLGLAAGITLAIMAIAGSGDATEEGQAALYEQGERIEKLVGITHETAEAAADEARANGAAIGDLKTDMAAKFAEVAKASDLSALRQATQAKLNKLALGQRRLRGGQRRLAKKFDAAKAVPAKVTAKVTVRTPPGFTATTTSPPASTGSRPGATTSTAPTSPPPPTPTR